MAGSSAKVNSIDQIIDADFSIAEFGRRPSQIRQWFTNNIIRPSLAYMVGWTGRKAVMVQVTSAGIIKTAASGTAIENYEVNDATAGIGYLAIAGVGTVTVTLTVLHSVLDLYSRDNELYAEIDNGVGTYGDKILMRGDLNESASRDVVVKRVRFSNVVTDGTKDGKAMLIAWR